MTATLDRPSTEVTTITVHGPAPVELLAVDRSAVFTFPDTTKNRLTLTQGRVQRRPLAGRGPLQLIGYHRDLDRRTLNGDEAEFSVCDDERPAAGRPGHDPVRRRRPMTTMMMMTRHPLSSTRWRSVIPWSTSRPADSSPSDDAAGNAAFNRTNTQTQGYGATLQAATTRAVGDRDNVLLVGAAIDLADGRLHLQRVRWAP